MTEKYAIVMSTLVNSCTNCTCCWFLKSDPPRFCIMPSSCRGYRNGPVYLPCARSYEHEGIVHACRCKLYSPIVVNSAHQWNASRMVFVMVGGWVGWCAALPLEACHSSGRLVAFASCRRVTTKLVRYYIQQHIIAHVSGDPNDNHLFKTFR